MRGCHDLWYTPLIIFAANNLNDLVMKYLIWPWLLFFFILSFSIFPWWFYPMAVVLNIIGILLDKKNAKKRERLRKRNNKARRYNAMVYFLSKG